MGEKDKFLLTECQVIRNNEFRKSSMDAKAHDASIRNRTFTVSKMSPHNFPY